MAGNKIEGATGLDGVTPFAATGATRAVDSDVIGAEARPVFVGTGTGGAATFTLGDVAAVDGDAFEAFVQIGAIGVATPAPVVKVTGGGGGTVALALERVGRGLPRRGLGGSFDLYYGRGIIPATGSAAIYAAAALDVGDKVAFFRPFLDVGALPARRQTWNAGAHLNPDLDRAAWPSNLPAFTAEDLELEPTPLRRGFTGDDGTTATRLVAGRSRHTLNATLVLDAEERDVLDQFWRANHSEFWIVRPDTLDLCIGEWAVDGDPKDTGGKVGSRRTNVRIMLREA